MQSRATAELDIQHVPRQERRGSLLKVADTTTGQLLGTFLPKKRLAQDASGIVDAYWYRPELSRIQPEGIPELIAVKKPLQDHIEFWIIKEGTGYVYSSPGIDVPREPNISYRQDQNQCDVIQQIEEKWNEGKKKTYLYFMCSQGQWTAHIGPTTTKLQRKIKRSSELSKTLHEWVRQLEAGEVDADELILQPWNGKISLCEYNIPSCLSELFLTSQLFSNEELRTSKLVKRSRPERLLKEFSSWPHVTSAIPSVLLATPIAPEDHKEVDRTRRVDHTKKSAESVSFAVPKELRMLTPIVPGMPFHFPLDYPERYGHRFMSFEEKKEFLLTFLLMVAIKIRHMHEVEGYVHGALSEQNVLVSFSKQPIDPNHSCLWSLDELKINMVHAGVARKIVGPEYDIVCFIKMIKKFLEDVVFLAGPQQDKPEKATIFLKDILGAREEKSITTIDSIMTILQASLVRCGEQITREYEREIDPLKCLPRRLEVKDKKHYLDKRAEEMSALLNKQKVFELAKLPFWQTQFVKAAASSVAEDKEAELQQLKDQLAKTTQELADARAEIASKKEQNQPVRKVRRFYFPCGKVVETETSIPSPEAPRECCSIS